MSKFSIFRGRLPTFAVATALVLSTLISAWQAVKANSRAAAEWNARQSEMLLREKAQANERRVLEVAVEAQSIVRFFGEWIITSSRPKDQRGGLGKDVTVREAVSSAEAAVAVAFRNEPLTEAMVRTVLGKAYAERGDLGLAIRQLEQAVQLTRAKLGDDHLDTLISINNLAVIYAKCGQFDRALVSFEETYRQLQRLGVPNHTELLLSMHNLAGVYQNLGKSDQAIALMEEALRREQATFGPEHPLVLMTMSNLAVMYDMAKDYAKAESILRTSLRLQQRIPGRQPTLMLDTQAFLGRALLHQEKYDEAAMMLAKCTLESQTVQPRVWQTFYYQTLLGGALLGEARNLTADDQSADDRLTKAEALLREGCEGMLAREDDMFAQYKHLIAESLNHLIALYKQLDRPEDVARWRRELESRISTTNSAKCGF